MIREYNNKLYKSILDNCVGGCLIKDLKKLDKDEQIVFYHLDLLNDRILIKIDGPFHKLLSGKRFAEDETAVNITPEGFNYLKSNKIFSFSKIWFKENQNLIWAIIFSMFSLLNCIISFLNFLKK